ncbi:hypothetical protein GCM10023113_20300 [Cellulomonas oligotrophica]|uniref:DUF4192 domain-containing protein n=2 Tax=Cellulomonas oligotrophica TaxID=931536 RepID=A0ABQ4DGD4_9CELL|nr:hypothetical protein Col01nite_36470 [Cellulomonas oligotrophica]
MDGAADVVRAVMDDVRRTDWAAWAICLPDQVVDVDPARVVPAVEALVDAPSSEAAERAYHLVLDAVGHDHSGTPTLAMVPAAHLLARLVPHLDVSASAAMGVVVECAAWCADVPAVVGPDGSVCDVAAETVAAARSLTPLASAWARSADAGRAAVAADLIGVVARLSA